MAKVEKLQQAIDQKREKQGYLVNQIVKREHGMSTPKAEILQAEAQKLLDEINALETEIEHRANSKTARLVAKAHEIANMGKNKIRQTVNAFVDYMDMKPKKENTAPEGVVTEPAPASPKPSVPEKIQLPETVNEKVVTEFRNQYFELKKQRPTAIDPSKPGSLADQIREFDRKNATQLQQLKEAYETTKLIHVQDLIHKDSTRTSAQAFLAGEVEFKREQEKGKWGNLVEKVEAGAKSWNEYDKKSGISEKERIARSAIKKTVNIIITAIPVSFLAPERAMSSLARRFGTSLGFGMITEGASLKSAKWKEYAQKTLTVSGGAIVAGVMGAGTIPVIVAAVTGVISYTAAEYAKKLAQTEKGKKILGKIFSPKETADFSGDIAKFEKEYQDQLARKATENIRKILVESGTKMAITAGAIELGALAHEIHVEKPVATKAPHDDLFSIKKQADISADSAHHINEAPSATLVSTGEPETKDAVYGMDKHAIVGKGDGITQSFKQQIEADKDLAKELAEQIGWGKRKVGTPAFYRALGEKFGYLDSKGHEIRVKSGDMAAYQIVRNDQAQMEGKYAIKELHKVNGRWEETETHYTNAKFESDTSPGIEKEYEYNYGKEGHHKTDDVMTQKNNTEDYLAPVKVEEDVDSHQELKPQATDEKSSTKNTTDGNLEKYENTQQITRTPEETESDSGSSDPREQAKVHNGKTESTWGIARGPDGRPWIVEDYTAVGTEAVRRHADIIGYKMLNDAKIAYVTKSYAYNLKQMFTPQEWENLSEKSATRFLYRNIDDGVEDKKDELTLYLKMLHKEVGSRVTDPLGHPLNEPYKDRGLFAPQESTKDYTLRMLLELEKRGGLEDFNKKFDEKLKAVEDALHQKTAQDYNGAMAVILGNDETAKNAWAKNGTGLAYETSNSGNAHHLLYDAKLSDYQNSAMPKMVEYMRGLHKITGIDPKGSESPRDYIRRCLEKIETTKDERDDKKLEKLLHDIDEKYKIKIREKLKESGSGRGSSRETEKKDDYKTKTVEYDTDGRPKTGVIPKKNGGSESYKYRTRDYE